MSLDDDVHLCALELPDCQWPADGRLPGTDPWPRQLCGAPAPHRVQMTHYTAETAVCPGHLDTALELHYVQIDNIQGVPRA